MFLPHTSTCTIKQSVSWSKVLTHNKVDDYTFVVSQNLWSVEFPKTFSTAAIDNYYAQIINAIKKAEVETLPYKSFKRHIKPYWNADLTLSRDHMCASRIEWINNCHCYNSNCVVFDNYKTAKKAFRAHLRKSVDEYECY